ncbi:class I SAM-dependent DNA methyltransferase [Sphingomonas sp. 28-63-12]|uniref:class I SAM-dependent DNA methyltransferase n=1 Tax=Sphingomonas sp. 28-63-12 TaxID=1970434 RepID=UPI000BCF21FC|nr:MAG: SAM-dependent methyltransferase [Sphingomonas sp. 28-63-12]
MSDNDQIESFVAEWALTGGSELANTQSFVNGLCALIGVDPPKGSRTDDSHNDYVFERRVFQKEADGAESFGRIDAYKRHCFVLEAKQGSDADRKAAEQGEADLDIFGQTAAARYKRGTAKRGTPTWSKAMVEARGQAERYAKALPIDHGWPPFLLVTDVGHCIDVYADFSGTGKQYTQFPDAARFRIALDDLRDDAVRSRLATIWTDPLSLDPSKEAARVTREIASHLAELSKRLESREQNPTRVADFLMRCLFTMFAEDVRLIPEGSFTDFLTRMQKRPENFAPNLSSLWQAMDKGGLAGVLGEAGETVLRFNGYLFKDTTAIALKADEIGLLIEAASHKWNHVEPAIFGTLLERALDGKERAKLGAHYTPRAYVERLVMPTIMEPLRADWAGVQAAAGQLIESGKANEAHAVIERFHAQLAQVKVLDPACGTGNFLYVALARMKELEGEVIGRLAELEPDGEKQTVAELSGHTITPENFLGIEINPRAAAIAQLVLWIGYLQWHFRVNGEGKVPPEPVLRDVKTIENRDALIDCEQKVLERDAHGKPLTRWDGETKKKHPVTGKEVPDQEARVEVYRYVKPRPTKWPKADFIVGNPPFIGKGKRAVEYLGRPYLTALKSASKVKLSADYVMHWWDRAANLARTKQLRRFGFITSATITQQFNTKVVRPHVEASKGGLSISYAIGDHPWVDEKGSAAVRIAMTVGMAGKADGRLLQIVDESHAPDSIQFSEQSGSISATLNISNDVKSAKPLKANDGLCSPGIKTFGAGFIIAKTLAERWLSELSPKELVVLRPYYGGKDVTDRWKGKYVIDVDHLDEDAFRQDFPTFYSHLFNHVKPERDENNEDSRRLQWWKFGRRNTELRGALAGCERFIVTTETAKHRFFIFLAPPQFPEGGLVVVASADAFSLGILSSRIHLVWMQRAKGALETRPRYNKQRCFDPFPFPANCPEPLKARIRAEAESLDGLRKQVLERHHDLTLTGLYNVLEALRANDGKGRPLTEKERDIHDRGLVTLIRQHHDAIDATVAEAYGWSSDLSDEDILARLVALNKTRAAEEAKGMIRWLRPDFQSPGATAPQVNATLDLGDAPAAAPMTIIPWPKTLAEQVSTVAAILGASQAPQHPSEIARGIKGTNARGVTPVLDALTAIGQARRLSDGRYAA